MPNVLAVTKRRVTDDDIYLEPLHIMGVLTVSPQIGNSGPQDKFSFFVKCHYPDFTDAMGLAVKKFARQHRSGGSPQIRTADEMYIVSFQASSRRGSHADRFVRLASELFIELWQEFSNWQAKNHFAPAAKTVSSKARK